MLGIVVVIAVIIILILGFRYYRRYYKSGNKPLVDERWIVLISIAISVVVSAVMRDFDPIAVGSRAGICLLVLLVASQALAPIRKRFQKSPPSEVKGEHRR